MTDDFDKDEIQWRLNRIQKLKQQNFGNDEMWNVMIKKLEQGKNLDEGDLKYFVHYSTILEESENKKESKPIEPEIIKAKKKGRVFLIIPAIAIGIIVYVIIANVGFWIPSQTVYEINTIEQVCDIVPFIYSGLEFKKYESITFDPMNDVDIMQRTMIRDNAKQQFIDDVMYNRKIDPELRYVVMNPSEYCK